MKRRRNSVNSTTPVVCKKAKINDSTSEDVTPVNKEQSVSPSTRKPLEKTPTTKVNAELIHVYTVTHSFDSWQGDRDENQDQYYVTENYSPDYLLSLLTQNIDYSKDDSDEKQTIGIFGVYDGHGPAGLEGAKITREKMPKFIIKNLSFLPSFAFRPTAKEEIQTALRRAIAEVQKRLIKAAKDKEPSFQEFGTTAIVAVLWGGDQLTVANVGDSRAVLYRSQDNNKYRIAHVSEDHNLLRQDETKRIEEAKGRIINKTGANPRVIPSNAIPHQEVMNKKLGLAMSRSLGHVTLSRFGVISEPDFLSCSVVNADILVLASDGLWNLLTSEEVTDYVQKYSHDVDKIVASLIDEVKARCLKRRLKADNTTIVVVKFKYLSSHEKVNVSFDLSNSISREDSATTISAGEDSDTETLDRCDTAILETNDE